MIARVDRAQSPSRQASTPAGRGSRGLVRTLAERHLSVPVSRDGLLRALAALDEHVSVAGTITIDEPLVLGLPDGSEQSVADPGFVAWLLSHGEAAPFGVGHETRLDPTVRSAVRLAARGSVAVRGFDPASVLPRIEASLSPRAHLSAKLTDVVVYPPGGHFALHKDTPRTSDLVATLVVALPIAHEGGALEVGEETIDWSGPCASNELRWAAMFTDVDHAVLPVRTGARVTLTYALERSGVARDDREWAERMSQVVREIDDLEMPEETPAHGRRGTRATPQPLFVPCARHVIVRDGQQTSSVDDLRGADRDLADAFVKAGYRVTVRVCLAARRLEELVQTTSRAWDATAPEVYLARLRGPFTDDDVRALRDGVTFVPAMPDGGGLLEHETSDLSEVCDAIPDHAWLARPASIATYLAQREFCEYGLVGNDAADSFLYRLVALQVERTS